MQGAVLGYLASGTVVMALEQWYVLQPSCPSKVSGHLRFVADERRADRAASQQVARESSRAAPRGYGLDHYAVPRFPLQWCKLGSGMYSVPEIP